jgi:hypothetical protein
MPAVFDTEATLKKAPAVSLYEADGIDRQRI